jgi:pSer/pThr/pTyr-binding forkhead associated (FHA) protein
MEDRTPPSGPEGTAAQPVPPEPPDLVPLRLLLQGSEMGVDLTRPDLVVGRHTDADLRLPLPDVSRRHCRFVFAAGRWQVFDLNSLNGIYVNGERVGQAVLQHHDIVRIGSYSLEVDLHAAGRTLRLDAGSDPRGPLVLERLHTPLPAADELSQPFRRQAS